MCELHSEEFNYAETYYKVTKWSERHHDYQYQDGLNVLTEPLAETGSCVPGGLYFTDLSHVPEFLDYGVYVREVRIPLGSRVVRVVRRSGEPINCGLVPAGRSRIF